MRKISIIVIFSIFFSFTSFSYSLNETRGNSIGNIANYGEVVENKDSVFYSYVGEGLIKVLKNGSKKSKICDFNADNLNIVGDYLYCRLYIKNSDKYQNSGIYKIKTDGSLLQKLNTDEADYMNVVGDYIYYVNAADNYKPYKMKTDGTGRRKINDYPMSNLNVIGDWIYFENHIKNASLYKMKTDGTKMTQLCNLSAYRMEINVIGDWVYFIAEYPDTGLYKVKTDGTQLKKLSSAQLSGLNVVGDTIYYTIYQNGIYKMKLDGTGNKLLVDVDTMGINIANGRIYYTSYDGGTLDFENTSFNSVNIDGSKIQRIFTHKSASNNMTAPNAAIVNAATPIASNSVYKYVINGKYDSLANYVIINTKTYLLPLRELSKLGIPDDHINYDSTEKSITITHNNVNILLHINSNTATINNNQQSIEAAPFINNDGTVYVPVELIADAVGKVLQIDGSSKTIAICDKSQYDMVKEILEKSDKAMNSLNSYKSKYIIDYISTNSKVQHENASIGYEVDKGNKQLKIKMNLVSGNESQDIDLCLSDGVAYSKDSSSGTWKKAKPTKDDYEYEFNSLCNLYELNSDFLCTGLQIQKDSDSNSLILKGDIIYKDLFNDFGYNSIPLEGENLENSLEITIDRQSYLVKEIKMVNKNTINEKEYKMSTTINYGSYNEKIIILAPDAISR